MKYLKNIFIIIFVFLLTEIIRYQFKKKTAKQIEENIIN
jgi:hypothetical protein